MVDCWVLPSIKMTTTSQSSDVRDTNGIVVVSTLQNQQQATHQGHHCRLLRAKRTTGKMRKNHSDNQCLCVTQDVPLYNPDPSGIFRDPIAKVFRLRSQQQPSYGLLCDRNFCGADAIFASFLANLDSLREPLSAGELVAVGRH